MMEKQFTLQQESARKRQAESILENPLYKEMCEHLQGEIQRQFKDCHPADTERLVNIKIADGLLEKVLKFFDQTIITGKMAEFQIDQEEKAKNANNTEVA